ncbi:MAG: sugar ABC transporter permease, partial [Liquorilactobacillus satsumensis]
MNSRSSKKNKFLTFAYLAPTAIILLVFMIIPIIYTLYLSFFDWNLIAPTKDFVGLENYISIFTDPVNQKVLLNTVFYIVLLLVLN